MILFRKLYTTRVCFSAQTVSEGSICNGNEFILGARAFLIVLNDPAKLTTEFCGFDLDITVRTSYNSTANASNEFRAKH